LFSSTAVAGVRHVMERPSKSKSRPVFFYGGKTTLNPTTVVSKKAYRTFTVGKCPLCLFRKPTGGGGGGGPWVLIRTVRLSSLSPPLVSLAEKSVIFFLLSTTLDIVCMALAVEPHETDVFISLEEAPVAHCRKMLKACTLYDINAK
jgi:hypothetical protein